MIHHREDIWEDPDTFNPERFAQGRKILPFTYLPFAAGPRTCIGKNFSIMEMKIVLSKMLTEFTFLDPNPEITKIETKMEFSIKPRYGVHIGFSERKF